MSSHDFHFQENRQSTRYAVRDSSAVMLMPKTIISYCVLDISKSGLAFYYNGQTNKNEILKNTLAVFFTDTAGTTNLPIQVISDTVLDEKSLPYQSKKEKPQKLYFRRCGIKFTNLSQDQENVVNDYIQSLSMNTIPLDDSVP